MEQIFMSRRDANISWGFRLQGGKDFHQRLSVQKVQSDSLAATSGLQIGDCLISVNGVATDGLTHHQALQTIKECGNNLRLSIVRYGPDILEFAKNQKQQKLSYDDKEPNFNKINTRFTNSKLGQQTNALLTTTAYSASPCEQQQLNGNHTSISEENILNEQLNGTYITLEPNTTLSLGFKSPQYNSDSFPTYPMDMANNSQHQQMQQDIPDQLLSQFSPNKRPEDRPFSYIPTGGIAELQQRQRQVAPPTRPKPKLTSRQTSLAESENSQASYDPSSLFTPAYLEMVKSQENMLAQPLPAAVSTDMVGYGPGKIPQEQVAAYILQPDGTMAALRWNDRPGPNLQNSAVMAALLEEQNAKMHGGTSGRIHPTGSGSKQGLSFKVLQWLTGTDSEDGSETASNYSGSHDGQYSSSSGHRMPHQSFDSQKFPEKISKDNNSNDLEYLYSGSSVPSKSFRRLLRSISTTTTTTDELSSLPSPAQESPAVTEGKSQQNRLKIISRGASQDKANPKPEQAQHAPRDEIAYCDF